MAESAWSSRVEFKGLTAMIMDLKSRAKKTMPLTLEFTKGLAEATNTLYIRNLSGSVPSTAARPLPVGVRTGYLRSMAKTRKINQYSWRTYNSAFYASFIESGTRRMLPRRPLGDAVDQISRTIPGEMGKVISKAWRV